MIVPAGYIPEFIERENGKYELRKGFTYYSPRYNKCVRCETGMQSDGATWACDIRSLSWWVHDKLCKEATFMDCTPVTNWQASMILHDILMDEERKIRAKYWGFFTFIFGGRQLKARNGWF